jgi:hypothetical protein
MKPTSPRVTPADCALALAIPLTRTAFLGDLDSASTLDFARSVARRCPATRREALWEDHYRPIAAIALQVSDTVERQGVTVDRETTLETLRALFARHAVVTVIAHWKFPGIEAADVLDPGEILRRIRSSPSPVARHLRDCLSRTDAALLATSDDVVADRATLAAALDAALEPTRAFYQRRVAGPRAEDLLAPPLRLTRAALEEELAGALRPGRSVELRDDLWPVADVVDAVPLHFDGVIDLTVCNSVILGEAIKRSRRRCLVAVNERPATLPFRLVRYKYIILELARSGGRYTDIMLDLNRALRERLS